MSTMKKVMAFCLAASFAVAAVGCSDKKQDIQTETISLDQTKQELTFDYSKGSAVDATEADAAEDAAETETVIEEVTEFVEVTEDGGQPVTDAEGAAQTQPLVVETRLSVVSNNNGGSGNGNAGNSGNSGNNNSGNNDNNNNGGNSGGNTQTYTPVYDTCKAYWLDMSQMGDYDFNGEFLKITFQVKDNIPQGSYPVSIATTDIASWDLVKYEPVKIDGEVAVDSVVADQQDITGSDFTLKVNSTSAKPGDLATVIVDLENNPGFCGFVIDIQYDSNALSIVEASAGSDFDAAVNVTQ